MSVLCLDVYVLKWNSKMKSWKSLLICHWLVRMSTFSSKRGKGHPECVLYVCAPSICFDVYDLEWKRKEFLKVHYMSVLCLDVNLLEWKRKKGCPESVLYVCELSACLDVYGLKLKRKGIFESPLCVCVLSACMDVYDLDWERKSKSWKPLLIYLYSVWNFMFSNVRGKECPESVLYVYALSACLVVYDLEWKRKVISESTLYVCALLDVYVLKCNSKMKSWKCLLICHVCAPSICFDVYNLE